METLANALADMRNEGIIAQIAEKYNVSAENAAEVSVIGGNNISKSFIERNLLTIIILLGICITASIFFTSKAVLKKQPR